MHGALDILELFLTGADADGLISFSELRQRSGLPHASFSRALKALCQRGYLLKERGGYAPGTMLMRLSAQALRSGSVQALCRPFLISMMQESGERAELFVRRGNGFVLVEFRDSGHELMLRSDVGSWRASTLVAAADLALAAHLPEDEREALIAQAVDSGKSGSSAVQLRARLDELRRKRVASVLLKNGVFRSAAPVFDDGGTCIAAMALAAPAFRLSPAQKRNLAAIVKRHAEAASEPASHRASA